MTDDNRASSNPIERLQAGAHRLQSELAMQDRLASMFTSRSSSRSFAPELIVLKLPDLLIRMDGNRNHHRAHVHIDLGNKRHAATYAIDTGKHLIGVSSQYDRAISQWIIRHQTDLQAVWDGMRAQGIPELILARLRGSDL